MTRRTCELFMLGVAMFLVSCASSYTEDQRFEKVAGDYIETYLRMNPEQATALGDHRYDDRLNDYSTAGVQSAIEFNHEFKEALEKIDADRLSNVNRIDQRILLNHVEGALFKLETLREYEWNPLVYNLGSSVYYLIARDFAPLEERLKNVDARLKEFRVVAALAKANLKNPPTVHVETAILQNQGTIALVRDELQRYVDHANLGRRALRDLNKARDEAVAALEYYGSWLENDLLEEADGDFRIGRDKFQKKLRYVLQSDLDMADILSRAEDDLASTQAEMFQTALPLYRRFFPGDTIDADSVDRKKVIAAVLDKLAESHPNNDNIVQHAEECLEECTAFTREKGIVSVPDDQIRLIVMPEFQRGVAVAYCDAPGPLEQTGETFYAISPTPADWDSSRVESFFREYNDYMLQNLTIHEAMPGHYLQLAHSNGFEAPTMVRKVFYSGTFVEGWATYVEQVMAELGYGGPEVKMQQLKMRLRLIINAIIDQKIHAAGMTEDEAIGLMMNEGFQEEGEASGKWRRACLTSTQLSTYYVGNIEVNDIRHAYEAKNGGGGLRAMHDQMIAYGSPPPRVVKELMGLR